MRVNLSFTLVVLTAVTLFGTGCASRTVALRETEAAQNTSSQDETSARGTTEVVWEEPMVDSVDVPPGLDPEGHYYRPGHKQIVEIRQGRWKSYKGSAD